MPEGMKKRRKAGQLRLSKRLLGLAAAFECMLGCGVLKLIMEVKKTRESLLPLLYTQVVVHVHVHFGVEAKVSRGRPGTGKVTQLACWNWHLPFWAKHLSTSHSGPPDAGPSEMPSVKVLFFSCVFSLSSKAWLSTEHLSWWWLVRGFMWVQSFIMFIIIPSSRLNIIYN